jgi:hypothetical protein
MKRESLRDNTGRTIGRIEDDGHKQLAYDSMGRFAGRYDKSLKMTYDWTGRQVTTAGNALSSLILSHRKK